MGWHMMCKWNPLDRLVVVFSQRTSWCELMSFFLYHRMKEIPSQEEVLCHSSGTESRKNQVHYSDSCYCCCCCLFHCPCLVREEEMEKKRNRNILLQYRIESMVRDWRGDDRMKKMLILICCIGWLLLISFPSHCHIHSSCSPRVPPHWLQFLKWKRRTMRI